MLCLFKISNPNNLILVIITFTFTPLVGVAVNVAVFFLELLPLKEVLKHQVNCDRVQWVASCRSEELNVCVRLRVCVRVFLHRYSNSIQIVEAEYWYSVSYTHLTLPTTPYV